MTKVQTRRVEEMRANGGKSWLADHTHGGNSAKTDASAWWRTMQSLERAGVVQRLRDRRGHLLLGFGLVAR